MEHRRAPNVFGREECVPLQEMGMLFLALPLMACLAGELCRFFEAEAFAAVNSVGSTRQTGP